MITTLTFSVSMSTQVVTIPILDDQIVEKKYEYFRVTLTTIDPAVTPNTETATVNIRDNDSKLWAIHHAYCMYTAYGCM